MPHIDLKTDRSSPSRVKTFRIFVMREDKLHMYEYELRTNTCTKHTHTHLPVIKTVKFAQYSVTIAECASRNGRKIRKT